MALNQLTYKKLKSGNADEAVTANYLNGVVEGAIDTAIMAFLGLKYVEPPLTHDQLGDVIKNFSKLGICAKESDADGISFLYFIKYRTDLHEKPIIEAVYNFFVDRLKIKKDSVGKCINKLTSLYYQTKRT